MILTRTKQSPAPRFSVTVDTARRVLDIVIAGSGLIILCPIMAVVVLAIWIEGGRPIFFSQLRLGQGARRFWIYKFRKFNVNSSGHRLTSKGDCRLTPIGRLLEPTKIDELPQLWNILKGDMSIVGPRPETLNFADCFVGSYRRVLDHKPGIFGPNQVLFRNESAIFSEQSDPERFYRDVLFPLKGRIDLGYFSSRTLLSDLAWIIRGTLAVLRWRAVPAPMLSATFVPASSYGFKPPRLAGQ